MLCTFDLYLVFAGSWLSSLDIAKPGHAWGSGAINRASNDCCCHLSRAAFYSNCTWKIAWRDVCHCISFVGAIVTVSVSVTIGEENCNHTALCYKWCNDSILLCRSLWCFRARKMSLQCESKGHLHEKGANTQFVTQLQLVQLYNCFIRDTISFWWVVGRTVPISQIYGSL